jgi:hypothetical protein
MSKNWFQVKQIYFARHASKPWIKIGRSDNPMLRVNFLGALLIFHESEGGFMGRNGELEIHRRFKRYHIRKEWYRDCPEIRAYIAYRQAKQAGLL